MPLPANSWRDRADSGRGDRILDAEDRPSGFVHIARFLMLVPRQPQAGPCDRVTPAQRTGLKRQNSAVNG